MAINNYFRDEEIDVKSLVVGTVFVFIVFSLIGTLTDKIGSEVGE